MLELGIGALVLPDQFALPRAADAYDEHGHLKNKDQQEQLKTSSRNSPAPRACCTDEQTMSNDTHAKDKLIVALDLPSYDDARALVNSLGDTVTFYKIGLELLFSDGLTLARELKHEGKRVFLDLKFLDIGNTVERAVASAAGLGVDFLTVHGHDTKTLKAAVRGRAGSNLKLLAVTVLTSLDQSDLDEQGISADARSIWFLSRAQLAKNAGFDGVIASGQEAARRSRRDRTGFPDRHARHSPCQAATAATKAGSRRRKTRFAPAPIISSSAVRSTPHKDPKAAAETFLSHIAGPEHRLPIEKSSVRRRPRHILAQL